jgi:D-serine deaminase-like pyridoxal phosphate-dependent protein
MYLASKVKTTFLLDEQYQIERLSELSPMRHSAKSTWSVFVLVDTGVQDTTRLKSLVNSIQTRSNLKLKGFFSDNSSISAANIGPQEQISAIFTIIGDLGLDTSQLTCSIEANTPDDIINTDTSILTKMHTVEWRIGSHAINDLQRVSTAHATRNEIAMEIRTRITSNDPSRYESIIEVGSSVLSRETSEMFPGYGIPTSSQRRWHVARMSETSACLVASAGNDKNEVENAIGDDFVGRMVELHVQNAGITANAFDYYFVIDAPRFLVTEVWKRWKPWL